MTPDPASSLCLGRLSLQIQEKGLHKEFFHAYTGGGLGGRKILYAEFLRVLFAHD